LTSTKAGKAIKVVRKLDFSGLGGIFRLRLHFEGKLSRNISKQQDWSVQD
jgi:hypothetical protein